MEFKRQQWRISKLLKNSKYLVIPDFQREDEAWTIKKKALFIDTIIKGWKTPKVYLNNPSESVTYEIVDGQQRIYTILAFLDGRFGIDDASGKKQIFLTLDEGLKKTIKEYKLDIEVTHNASYEEIAELFSRLQQGVALNAAEKLNAIPGKLTKFIKVIEKHGFFDKTGFRKKRYGLRGLCQQICYLEVQIKQGKGITSAKYPNLSDWFSENKNFDNVEIKNHINSTLDFMNKVFDSKNAYISRAGNIISIYLLCSWILEGEKEDRYKNPKSLSIFFNKFFLDFDAKNATDKKDILSYNLALLQSTSGGTSIKTRDAILKKYLYFYEPGFCHFLTREELKDFYLYIDSSLSEKVQKIESLITDINKRAIGSGRSIVFDTTSGSVHTFVTMPVRIKNKKGFRNFIEVIWKTFYEGSQSANRLGNFVDDRNHTKGITDTNILIKIDDLRKIEAHDLEHDKATYAAKIKTACDTLKHYTGKSYEEDFTENDFSIFQYKVIQELLDFLEHYRDSLKTSH